MTSPSYSHPIHPDYYIMEKITQDIASTGSLEDRRCWSLRARSSANDATYLCCKKMAAAGMTVDEIVDSLIVSPELVRHALGQDAAYAAWKLAHLND